MFLVDENHEKWLKRRRGEQQGAVRLLERLRRRREEVVAVEEAARRSEEWRKSIAAKYAAAEAQRKASEEARRKAAQRRAEISTIEDQRRAVADLQRNTAAGRSVLGERTNAVAVGSTHPQRSVVTKPVEVGGAQRVPPGYWPSVVPPRHPPPPSPSLARHPQLQPQHKPQPPLLEQHGSARQGAARGTQPLLRPAGAPFIPPVNSWAVDVESQSQNTGRLRARVHRTSLPAHNEEPTDCGCSVSAIVFVFSRAGADLRARAFRYRSSAP